MDVQNKRQTIRLNGSEKDWQVFNKHVKKRVKKHNADYGVVGHTHIYKYMPQYNIFHTGTFIRYDVTHIGKWVIISDAHLTTKTIKRKEKLLMYLNHYKDHVILNGDIFELWLDNPEKVIEANKEILEAIYQYNPVFIRGNHDYELEKYLPERYKNIKILDEFYFEHKNHIYYVYHGWQDDPVMKNLLVRLWCYAWLYIGDNMYNITQKLAPYRNKILNFLNRRK